MHALSAGVVGAVLGISLAVASPAGAEVWTTTDPAGDGLKGRLLDVTSIKVDNRDHAVVTTVSVVRLGAGDIGLRFRTRSHDRRELAGVLSERIPGRHRDVLSTVEGRQRCHGLRVTWDREADRIRTRLPSRCWNGGDYGAVQVKVITESGSDADLAPKGSRGGWRWTTPTPRG